MGYDLSGVVAEFGNNASKFKVGDEVVVRPNQDDAGSLAGGTRLVRSGFDTNIVHAEIAAKLIRQKIAALHTERHRSL